MKIVHLKRLERSIGIAAKGIIYSLIHEENFRLLFIASLLLIALSFIFPLSESEKAIIFLSTFTVLGMELINAQIEKVLNIVQPERDIRVKTIKDLSAAAVLLIAIGLAFISLIIFLPKIFFVINNYK